jgi:AraC family transcriptional regulator
VTLASRINLVDPLTGQRFPSAPDQYDIEGHRLISNLGGPVRFGWRTNGRTHEGILPPSGLCLQSDGEPNAPFWQDEMTVAAVAISPAFVTTLLEDRAPAAVDPFAERRCHSDLR